MPIKNRIADFESQMIEWRHHFHKYPELAYKEINTSKKIVELLKNFGVDRIEEGVGGTGVVGVINNGEGKSIGLRGDMDALPIREDNEKSKYCSKNKGVMHACGHDGHTTMLLGAAKYLSETRNFKGKVVLIFQPAEEGFAGAKAMIEDGLLERFPIEQIYGMHNMPGLEKGILAIQEGPRLAAADNFSVDIIGKGAHGAMPSNSIDPIICTSAIVQNLQHIVSRNSNPKETLVLTVASFNSGNANNVIPKAAKITGTIRYYNNEIGKLAEKRFHEVVENTCRAYGANSIVEFKKGYPATINHKEPSMFAFSSAKKVVGVKATNKQNPMMGSEDFSYFLNEVPGAFAWIGNGDSASLHNPKYDFNDNILSIGASFLSTLAEDFLT
tara:strand:+ start:4826 stop:5980 length:1155 start_codon:yes stop_codon:yes gene_type:complete